MIRTRAILLLTVLLAGCATWTDLYKTYTGEDAVTVSGVQPGLGKVVTFSNDLTISIDEVDGRHVDRAGGLGMKQYANFVRVSPGRHLLRLEILGGFPPKTVYTTVNVSVKSHRSYQFGGRRSQKDYWVQFWDTSNLGPDSKPLFETTIHDQ
jgi:hypothetical protein